VAVLSAGIRNRRCEDVDASNRSLSDPGSARIGSAGNGQDDLRCHVRGDGSAAIGTLGDTALSLLDVNPIHLLVLVAVINGVAAAPFLVVVMWVSSSQRLMGDYVNGKAAKILG
jgi:hypothetical protein